MSDGPTVSVVIRAFRRRWLGEAIASVLAQTYRDLELVVYDDAGDLQAVVADFADERIRYHLARERLGASGRYNAAVALCRGRYVGVLDDDDRYEPGFVERLLDALEADAGAAAAVGGTLWDQGGVLVAPPDSRPPGVQGDALRAFLEARWVVTPSTALWRRSALNDGQRRWPMPDGLAPDLFVNVRAAAAGWRFVVVGAPLVLKRWHPDRVSRPGLVAHGRAVETWQRLPIADPELDRVRREQLARSRISRAGYRLRAGDRLGARTDLHDARADDRQARRWTRRALVVAARVPLAGAAGMRLWLALPHVRHRQERPPGVRLPAEDAGRPGSGGSPFYDRDVPRV